MCRDTAAGAPGDRKRAISPVSLQRLLDEGIIQWSPGHGSRPSEYKGRGEIPYIRVSDIVNWELYRNPTSGVPRHIYEKVKGKRGISLEPRDIVFVRRGSYRIGTVAMASPHDKEVLLTREFVVLRVVKPDNDYGPLLPAISPLASHDTTAARAEDLYRHNAPEHRGPLERAAAPRTDGAGGASSRHRGNPWGFGFKVEGARRRPQAARGVRRHHNLAEAPTKGHVSRRGSSRRTARRRPRRPPRRSDARSRRRG